MSFPLYLTALTIAVSTSAAFGKVTESSCRQAKESNIGKCEGEIVKQREILDSITDRIASECKENPSTPVCATDFSNSAHLSSQAIDKAKVVCEAAKKDCDKKCDKSQADEKERGKVENLRKQCNSEIDRKTNKLNAEKPQAETAKKAARKLKKNRRLTINLRTAHLEAHPQLRPNPKTRKKTNPQPSNSRQRLRRRPLLQRKKRKKAKPVSTMLRNKPPAANAKARRLCVPVALHSRCAARAKI